MMERPKVFLILNVLVLSALVLNFFFIHLILKPEEHCLLFELVNKNYIYICGKFLWSSCFLALTGFLE